MFDIPRVMVAKAVKATNNEGATEAYSFAFGKGALLAHIAPQPGLLTPSAGYTFAWTGVSGGLGATIGTSQFRMESIKADRVEAEMAWDNKSHRFRPRLLLEYHRRLVSRLKGVGLLKVSLPSFI
jgi:hypothetical protein